MSCFLGSAYYAVWLGLCFHFFGCRFALGFIVYPFFENVVLLACINWSWHAFLDPADPHNEFVQVCAVPRGLRATRIAR